MIIELGKNSYRILLDKLSVIEPSLIPPRRQGISIHGIHIHWRLDNDDSADVNVMNSNKMLEVEGKTEDELDDIKYVALILKKIKP
jgi:hypothetical protein